MSHVYVVSHTVMDKQEFVAVFSTENRANLYLADVAQADTYAIHKVAYSAIPKMKSSVYPMDNTERHYE